ncbi:MAG TPA: hypothetical protein VE961_15465, partial [Pyrinomonadaceae bacterium]|nr:hypothetical protein [Pyrinomonadaceae bacterium]
EAVLNIAIFVNDDYVFDPAILITQQRLFRLILHLIQVLAARETFNPQGDSGQDRLPLFQHEAGVRAGGPQIDVILCSQGKHQERRQQEQQPNAETIEESGQGNLPQQKTRHSTIKIADFRVAVSLLPML